MTIGELSKLSQLSVHCLRYYESLGLLSDVAKNRRGQRVYTEAHQQQLAYVGRAQRLGFSLSDIRQLMTYDASKVDSKLQTRALAEQKLVQLEQQLADLQAMHGELSRLVSECQSTQAAETCPILGRLSEAADAS